MGAMDQTLFRDAVAKANSGFEPKDYKPAVHALSRLSMPDMLRALELVSKDQRSRVWAAGGGDVPWGPLRKRGPGSNRICDGGGQYPGNF